MKYVQNAVPEWALFKSYITYEERHQIELAFEAEHKCKIVRSYESEPPKEWQELTVREANTYRWLEGARFIGRHLVADRTGEQHGHAYESLCSMLDGLYRGYVLALGPTKPYYIKYEDLKLKPGFPIHEYPEPRRIDDIPANAFRKPKVIEMWFTTEEEAQKHLDDKWKNTAFPGIVIHQWNHREVLRDRRKDQWF